MNNENSCTKSPKPAESPQPAAKQSDQPVAAYEYYDAGNHWCKDCNTICGTMFDFFTHMHNKKHTQVGILPSVISILALLAFIYSYLHYKAGKMKHSHMGRSPTLKSQEIPTKETSSPGRSVQGTCL